jgi:hypothetical protein
LGRVWVGRAARGERRFHAARGFGALDAHRRLGYDPMWQAASAYRSNSTQSFCRGYVPTAAEENVNEWGADRPDPQS